MQRTQASGPRADDRAAQLEFLAWIEPHWDAMRRVAWRFCEPGDFEDVLQNALLSAWRHRGRFDASRGSPGAWLTTITINEARKSGSTD
jgi:RNA polymerase sigma-70 factor (ECF subfamily)